MQTRQIPERDWKYFRKLQNLALERFCQRVLDEVASLSDDASRSAHDRYLAVYKTMRRRDKELEDAFDRTRRSTAWFQLALIVNHRLLTEEELAGFSPETHEVLRLLLKGE